MTEEEMRPDTEIICKADLQLVCLAGFICHTAQAAVSIQCRPVRRDLVFDEFV